MAKLKSLALIGPKACDIAIYRTTHEARNGKFDPEIPYDDLKGLYLSNLVDIAALVPRLEDLKVSLQATDETPEPIEGGSPFQSLKSFTIISSFFNFNYQGFDFYQTACFLSSVLDIPVSSVHFIEDNIYEYDDDDSDDPDSATTYINRYRGFFRDLEACVRNMLTN